MQYLKKILSLIVFISLVSADSPHSFEKEYNHEIKNAKLQFQKIEAEFVNQANKYGTDKSFVSAIIFPEIVRYSIYKDFFETKVLEYYYVRDGAKAADFSIGAFQMKPSFVEQLEVEVKKNPALKKYNSITKFQSNDPQGIRSERIERLKNVVWQITYANCFCTMMDNKFQNINFSTTEKKLQFYASAYNHGFNCSANEINKWIKIKSYPNGYGNEKSNYCYVDVALYFYNELKK